MIIVFLRDSQERLTLLASHPGNDDAAQHWAEATAHQFLLAWEPDSESHLVTARVIDTIEVGDFVVRGPTP